MASYAKLPEIKELTKKLFKEVGVVGFFKLYKNVIPTKLKIAFINSRKMKKIHKFGLVEIKITPIYQAY